MTGTDTDPKAVWAAWLKRQLGLRGWTSGDLIERGEDTFKRNTVFRWLNGQNLPQPKAALRVAEIFGIDPREAYEAAGLTHLMDMEGDIVTTADPVEVFVARVRARGFSKPVEDRLIEYVRAEIEARKAALDQLLDTVEDAQRIQADDMPD